MAARELLTPDRFTGADLDEQLKHFWPGMRRTRRNAEASNRVIAGEDTFTLPETFVIAGASQYIAEIPHPRTVPARVLQKVIAKRPKLSIPLGPKGLGITAQRLTTKVEQPLNAICEDRKAGFQWQRACALLAYEGFCAGITVLDPADWRKHQSAWDDSEYTALMAEGDAATSPEAKQKAYDAASAASSTARRRAETADAVFRARNVPIRHRAIGIRQCAPIFDGDYDKVGGIIISQEFSRSYLKRHYEFGDEGLLTATGRNGQDGTTPSRTGQTGGVLTLIEGWLYDDEGIPYVTYAIRGGGGSVAEVRWKSGPNAGELAVIDLKDQFGLDRLPVTWRFGLGNPGEIDADMRAMGFVEPFIQGWRSVRAKMTANNVAILFQGYPVLIEESLPNAPMLSGSLDDDDADDSAPDLLPMKITKARPGTTLRRMEGTVIDAAVYKQIELEMGAISDESPGKSNKDQSGFSQSMAEAFEEFSITTVHDGLGELYEDHGSFVLEAGKRLPEMGKKKGTTPYPPIMVFRATDVPTRDKPGSDKHNEPMELDPALIDETFTCVALYSKSMSIPERQQSMEEVARNLKTRRKHLEDTGDTAPETTELELLAEQQRADPTYAKTILWPLVQKIQGAEDVKAITEGQQQGLANEQGMPMGLNQGVAPVPPGMPMPMQQGAPGVPAGGSVTGMSPPDYGQSSLAGAVAGAGMTGPINTATQDGGMVPQGLPAPAGAPI